MSVRNSGQILKRIRSLLKSSSISNEALSAFIISSGDAHQSEYIADCDDRISFISGFTGSTSTSVITLDDAALWTDGRYFLQAEKELFPGWILMKDGLTETPSPGEWLNKVLPSGSKVGCDSFLASSSQWTNLAKVLTSHGNHLVPVASNPIDLVWEDRPAPPSNPIEPYPTSFAGKSWQEKVEEVRKEMVKKDANALVLTALDDIAWLLNLRGSDITYNPVFFAYIVVTMDVINFFVDESKLDNHCRKHLNLDASSKPKIELREYKLIAEFLKWLVAQDNSSKIWLDNRSSHALVSIIPESRRISLPNPVLLAKAVKNKVEIECMKRAHVKDAVALCEFFAWLEDEIVKGELDEVKAANKLEEFRRTQEEYIGPSFETISASGPNGAIIHYKPSPESARTLSTSEMYLCDSGAQFRDGTTDVTRTMHFGEPTQYERECFTRVLKGHIDLAQAHFPSGIQGQLLDSFARRHLWEVGLDYLHGTGHGVGVYLNVHEGPMGIHFKHKPDDPGLKEGMILSNEPGYYEDGKFGIRIESLILAKKVNLEHNFKDRGYLGFETITLVPIQTKLLEPSLLSIEEIEWLDNYHATCRDVIGKALKEQGKTNAYQWLMKETQPLG
uniref:Aminopeptidase P N-terminal domain-containing protein n=2 Tax=Tetranychus urticae TaxID=32264 RepID=T1KRQ9_TETUR